MIINIPFEKATPAIGDVIVYSDGTESIIVDIDEEGIFLRGDSFPSINSTIEYIQKK